MALAFAAGQAHANGRYPSAVQLAFDPVDAGHLALITTFGLVESRDGGASFNWICEPVLGLSGTIDPVVAITDDGVTVVAGNYGVVTSGDGCSFSPGAELTSMMPPDLTLSRSVPGELFAFTTAVVSGDRFDSRVMHSVDDGRTWTVLAVLPDDLLPITIDVAPSDAQRVYVSGRLGSAGNYASVLLRSDDAGATFERTATIPGSEGLKYAYIAAVHATDPELVYVRVADPAGTVVLKSDDGGTSFEPLFTGSGQLLGFALSENELSFGGPLDGLWMGDSDGSALERRSDVAPYCLAYGPDGLYVCADSAVDGFSLARFRASDGAFEPVLTFSNLCGSTACAAGTQAGTTCPHTWSTDVARRIGSTCMTGSAGAPGGGSAGSGQSSTGGVGQGGNAAAGGQNGDGEGGDPRGGSSGESASSDSGSCALGAGRGPTRRGGATALAFAALAALARRRWTRLSSRG